MFKKKKRPLIETPKFPPKVYIYRDIDMSHSGFGSIVYGWNISDVPVVGKKCALYILMATGRGVGVFDPDKPK